MTAKLAYRRVLLKVSGEALMGPDAFGIHGATMERIATGVGEAVKLGVEVALVVGGGNIFRGLSASASGMDRANADQMGMLATVINALALQDALERAGIPARTMSAIPMPTVCESFTRGRAMRHLAKGRVVVFGGGTGNPYFTTDTTAALRAAEINADALFKGTQVDGIYSADPKHDANARRYDTLSYDEVLSRGLKVMDGAAIALARDNEIPVIVFSLQTSGAFLEVLRGQGRYTIVQP